MTKQNGNHYDNITLAWDYIMGKHFHYGYFKNGNESLDEATDALVYQMASYIKFSDTIKLLDVGCGVGHTALILQEICDCSIHGITNSLVGVNEAEKNVFNNNIAGKITFSENDASDSELSGSSYDIVWMMETSHLIPDKAALLREAYRLLKNGGFLLLCDIILLRELTLLDIVRFQNQLITVDKAFGQAKTETFRNYVINLESAGFLNINTVNISNKTAETFVHWRNNATKNKDKICEAVNPDYQRDFIAACDIMSEFNSAGILGYGIITAMKPD